MGVYPRPGPARQRWDTESFIDWGVRLGRESDGWDKRQKIGNGFIYDTAAPGGLPAPSEPPGKGVVFFTTTCAAVEVTVIRSNMWFKSWGPIDHLPFFRSSGEKHATRLLHTERDNASAAPCTYIPAMSHSSGAISIHLHAKFIAIFIAHPL